jgi:hypothetical protein
MAGRSTSEWKSQLGPSTLRNEIYQASTDDESANEPNYVQVPDSQADVPETQFENSVSNARFDENGLYSPKFLATLARCDISKVKSSAEELALNISLLRKENLVGDSASSTPFSFQPMRQVQPKTPTAKDKTLAEPVGMSSHTHMSIETKNDGWYPLYYDMRIWLNGLRKRIRVSKPTNKFSLKV